MKSRSSRTNILKICLLGNGLVGKTSLRTRYLGEDFNPHYSETIGADFGLKIIKILHNNEERIIKFQIWDISGQGRYQNVRPILFDRSDCALLVFDISSHDSLPAAYEWMKSYVRYASIGAVCLVGNKADLRNENIPDLVTKEEAMNMAEVLSKTFDRPVPYIETSAKTGQNVEEAFITLAQLYLDMSDIILTKIANASPVNVT